MEKLNLQTPVLNVENQFLKKDLPIFKIGDTVKVGVKIIEGNKERIQSYEGTIIAKKNSYDGKNVFSSLCNNNNCCTYASLHNVKYKPFTNNKHITYCKLCNKSL